MIQKVTNRKLYYFYIPVFAIICFISYYANKYIYFIQQNIISSTNGTLTPIMIYLVLCYLLILLAFAKPIPNNKSITVWLRWGSFMYVGIILINLLSVISDNELLYTPYILTINISNILLLMCGSFCFTKVSDLLIQYLKSIDFIGKVGDFLSNEKVLTAVVVAVITACFGLLGK